MKLASFVVAAALATTQLPAPHVSVGARLGGLATPSSPASISRQLAAVESLSLATLIECDDVVRMVLPASALAPMRERDHVELVYAGTRQVQLPALQLGLPVAHLFIPLDVVGTDWLIYVQRSTERPVLEVYRQRAPKAAALQALRSAVGDYIWSLRRHARRSAG